MTRNESAIDDRRRRLLAGSGATAAVGSAGCIGRIQEVLSRPDREQVELSIKCLPADRDPVATTIGRRLATALERVGVAVSLDLMSEEEIRREVLLAQDFDLYVGRFPTHHDPDYLHALLHSINSNKPGWLNPFGFTDLDIDDLLERQRREDAADRRMTVWELLESIVTEQPFSVLAVPDDIGAARTDRFSNWAEHGPLDPLRYLQLEHTGSGDPGTPVELRLSTTDESVTRGFNPLAVEFGDHRLISGLIYDPLGRRIGDDIEPWLAEELTWTEEADELALEILVREGVQFHDGNPLSADDVVFTYRFLADTSLGRHDSQIPAPRFQGRTSTITEVSPVNGRRLRLRFGAVSRPVARRALTVPILPEHIWADKTGPAQIAGFELIQDLTEALVWTNRPPIGSGPLRFDEVASGTSLRLAAVPDHFVQDLQGYQVPYDALSLRVTPSDAAAVELAAEGDVDATASAVSPDVVPRIGRSVDLQLLIHRRNAFYHVGYNVRGPPLSNPHFRRIIPRLVDKGTIVEDILDGYAAPAAAPLAGTGWLPDTLAWRGSDPEVPFLGENGELDVGAVRDAFRDAGYSYDGEGRLLPR